MILRQAKTLLGIVADNSVTGVVSAYTYTAPSKSGNVSDRMARVTAISWHNPTGATLPTVALQVVRGGTAYSLGSASTYLIGATGEVFIWLSPGDTIRFNITGAGNGTSHLMLCVEEYSP